MTLLYMRYFALSIVLLRFHSSTRQIRHRRVVASTRSYIVLNFLHLCYTEYSTCRGKEDSQKMQESMTEYTNFRKRLDAVLRTRDVQQVSDFLIAEGQWQTGTPIDGEFAI